MRRMLPTLLALSVFAASAQAQQPAQPASTTPATAAAPTADEVLKALRVEMQASRADLMAKNLTLTAEQASKFWPLLDAYMKEQSAIIDAQLKGVQQYIESGDTMSDAAALGLMQAHLRRDGDMNALRQKWLGEFQKVLPGKLAARAMQIDLRLSLSSQVWVSSRIPLIH